ncbi:hypothetical protein [Nitrosomonas sp.]|uniref:hypothetical protein n=1 Tax=Nitrosomonas sp. TaxID=42353 RepID=UPI002624976D|nr:hypothetical protein [Nitrosomonas sp.]
MSIYDFEYKSRRKFLDHYSENKALKEFAERLGFENSNYQEHRDILLNFILNYHKLIHRYEELISVEQWKQNFYTGISLFLLFSIPILLYVAPSLLKNYAPNGDLLAQIAAILTGLLTVQKSLSSWLDKRKIVGNFRKAQSALKAKLYAFEDKWRGQVLLAVTENEKEINKLKDDFLQEVRIAIREAQAIVEEEQNLYFDTITSQSIDLGAMLIEARQSAKNAVGVLIPSQTENQQLALIQKRRTVVQLEAEIREWENLVG